MAGASDLTHGDALTRECVAMRDWLREAFRLMRDQAATWEPRAMPEDWYPDPQ